MADLPRQAVSFPLHLPLPTHGTIQVTPAKSWTTSLPSAPPSRTPSPAPNGVLNNLPQTGFRELQPRFDSPPRLIRQTLGAFFGLPSPTPAHPFFTSLTSPRGNSWEQGCMIISTSPASTAGESVGQSFPLRESGYTRPVARIRSIGKSCPAGLAPYVARLNGVWRQKVSSVYS